MSLHWARLVHEKLAVIATFVHSYAPLQAEREHFNGEWKFLNKITFELPRQRATHALIDFALYFRALDDEEDLTGYWKQTSVPSVGTLIFKDGETKPLSPREMSNKIIHAEAIEWDFSEQPKIVCTGRDKEAWVRANINVRRLLSIGAQLSS